MLIILNEYNEVLRRKKFKFSEVLVAEFLGEIEGCGKMIVPSATGEILHGLMDLIRLKELRAN